MQVQLKTRGSEHSSATITRGNFFGEESLRRNETARPAEPPEAKKQASKFAAAVRRTGILGPPEAHGGELKEDEYGNPISTTVLVLDARDLLLLCDHRTLAKIEEVAAVVRKTRTAAMKRQAALFSALQAGVGDISKTMQTMEAQRMAEMAKQADRMGRWREPAGGATPRGAYQEALVRARHRKLHPKSPRAPLPPIEKFRTVERSFAEFKSGISSAYVLLEAMPIEALTQLQESAKRVEEKVQAEFLLPLIANLKAQRDSQMAQTTARGTVGRWKAATKASTPRDWLLQLEHLLQHTERELNAVRAAVRLAQPEYDWLAAAPLCVDVEKLIAEATMMLHKLLLRKPEAPAVMVVTDDQTAALDAACELADKAIGEQYNLLVRSSQLTV